MNQLSKSTSISAGRGPSRGAPAGAGILRDLSSGPGAIARPIVTSLAALVLGAGASAAGQLPCAPTGYSAGVIAAAIAASPVANAALKRSAFMWGGAAKSESGGNVCASNGYNFGVLQLHRGNLPRGITPAAYLAQPLQQQVDAWAAQVGNLSALAAGFQALEQAQATGAPIGATPVTPGMLAACLQFGPTICYNDVVALRSGQPCGGARPVNINWTGRHPGNATTDGNGQTICSWGGAIATNIETAATECQKAGAPCAPSNLTDYPLLREPPTPDDIVF